MNNINNIINDISHRPLDASLNEAVVVTFFYHLKVKDRQNLEYDCFQYHCNDVSTCTTKKHLVFCDL